MKFCQPHWTALKTAVEARGLGHLIAANGRDAAARVAADLKGAAEVDDYDPLMSAHWMIVNRVLEHMGLALMFDDLCPVCEAIEGHKQVMTRDEVEQYYIDGPADAVLAHCRELGIAEAMRGP
jgi:hypothetical protein